MRLIIAKQLGKCPLRAPTKNNLEEANIPPFSPLKVERATDKGIIHEKKPRTRSPKVTAIVSEVKTSSGAKTAKYAIFANR